MEQDHVDALVNAVDAHALNLEQAQSVVVLKYDRSEAEAKEHEQYAKLTVDINNLYVRMQI